MEGTRYALVLILIATACGDDPGSNPDSAPRNNRLEILDPPGDQLGLALGAATELGVRYLDPDGEPIEGANVMFMLVGDPVAESTGGAVLAASAAETDGDGVALVGLTAGQSLASFRVEARAELAAAVQFFVTVSDQGFAALSLVPRHEGPRQAKELAGVELRLFAGVSCAAVVDDLPESTYPVRTGPFDAPLEFRAVIAGAPHALLAISVDAEGRRLGEACLELGGSQLRAGSLLNLDVVIADIVPALGGPHALVSSLELPLDSPAWRTGRCASGAAQILVDAMLAPLAPDSATRVAIEAKRGAPDANGCRPATLPSTAASVDGRVMTALKGTPNSTASHFAAVATLVEAMFGGFELDSVLDGTTHSLQAARAGGVTIDLRATTRPVLDAYAVPITRDGDALTLGEHAYTLQPGALLQEMLEEGTLVPAGITGGAGTLGTQLVADAKEGAATGCTAVSAAACSAAGLASGCLSSTCDAARLATDALLEAPFTRLAAAGLDFRWQGTVVVRDVDHDLVLDAFTGGLWAAEVVTTGGMTLPATGTFALEE